MRAGACTVTEIKKKLARTACVLRCGRFLMQKIAFAKELKNSRCLSDSWLKLQQDTRADRGSLPCDRKKFRPFRPDYLLVAQPSVLACLLFGIPEPYRIITQVCVYAERWLGVGGGWAWASAWAWVWV